MASLYRDKFMDMDLYNDTYDLFCKQIEKSNPKIFEIGCGPGNITRYISLKRPDFNVEAIDVSPVMIKLAKENNPAAHFKVMDCREIDTLTSRFDGIICGFCIPYLSKTDCAKFIQDCSALLNTGGLLYLSLIEGDYAQSGYETASSGDQAYVYYYGEDFLREKLKENNFETANLIRKEYPKTEKTSLTNMIFITKKR